MSKDVPQTSNIPQIVKKEIDGTHYYFVNDEFYPSVTHLLSVAAPMPWSLKDWLSRTTPEQQEEIKQMATGFGSKMHDAYERLLNGLELNLAKDYPTTKEKKHIVAFINWHNMYKPTQCQSEQVVASLTYRYAGTLDLVCMINGERWLIDFKTSAAIYHEYELQVAAYKQAYEEMTGLKIDKMGIVRTGTRHKSGFEFKEITRPFSSFKLIYDTYLDMHDGKLPEPPKMDVYPQTIKLSDYANIINQ